ncbi:MAG: hypothetical protein ACREUI_10675, partial [Burkholderiales bacterium]
MTISRVALDVPVQCLFDYAAPGLTREHIGMRVLVPFGKKQMVGLVMDVTNQPSISPQRIKPISFLFQDIPVLSPQMLSLFRFCSDYYHHPLGQVVMNALPARLRRNKPITQKSNSWFALTDLGHKLDLSGLPAKAVAKRKLLERLK